MITKNSIFLFLGGIFAVLSFYSKNLPLLYISIFSLMILVVLANIYLFQSSKKTFLVFLLIGSLLYILEIIAANTGIIYGDFTYNSLWKPALFGTPVIMLFVWATLIMESYTLASNFFKKPFIKIITSSIFLVLLDLVIDPGAIDLGMWKWANSGIWYGVPTSNYFGWFILGILGGLILHVITKKYDITLQLRSFIMYNYTLAFWTVYTFLHNMYLASIIGFLLVGIVSIPSRKTR